MKTTYSNTEIAENIVLNEYKNNGNYIQVIHIDCIATSETTLSGKERIVCTLKNTNGDVVRKLGGYTPQEFETEILDNLMEQNGLHLSAINWNSKEIIVIQYRLFLDNSGDMLYSFNLNSETNIELVGVQSEDTILTIALDLNKLREIGLNAKFTMSDCSELFFLPKNKMVITSKGEEYVQAMTWKDLLGKLENEYGNLYDQVFTLMNIPYLDKVELKYSLNSLKKNI